MLSSYRYSFNDMLPSVTLMNGLCYCKGNNELPLSMQYWESLPDHTASAQCIYTTDASWIFKKALNHFHIMRWNQSLRSNFIPEIAGVQRILFFRFLRNERGWEAYFSLLISTKMHSFCYLILHVENGFVKYVLVWEFLRLKLFRCRMHSKSYRSCPAVGNKQKLIKNAEFFHRIPVSCMRKVIVYRVVRSLSFDTRTKKKSGDS